MSTTHNIHGDLAAGAATMQPTDEVAIYEAATGLAKRLTGSLLAGGMSGVVNTTATVLSITATQHANKLVIISTNSTVANTFTLPAATGSGAKYEFINGIAQTQGSIVIKCAGSDLMAGRALSMDSTAVATHGNVFVTLTATQFSWNRTTTGGIGHDHAVLWDGASGLWRVLIEAQTSGDDATPFS